MVKKLKWILCEFCSFVNSVMHQFKGDGEGILTLTLYDHIKRIDKRSAFIAKLNKQYNSQRDLDDDNVEFSPAHVVRRKRVRYFKS